MYQDAWSRQALWDIYYLPKKYTKARSHKQTEACDKEYKEKQQARCHQAWISALNALKANGSINRSFSVVYNEQNLKIGRKQKTIKDKIIACMRILCHAKSFEMVYYKPKKIGHRSLKVTNDRAFQIKREYRKVKF